MFNQLISFARKLAIVLGALPVIVYVAAFAALSTPITSGGLIFMIALGAGVWYTANRL